MAQDDEIEDVMASVRRLVSTDGVAARPAEPVEAVRMPILLLGPSCRVTDADDPFQMIRSLAQEEQDARDARHLLEEEMRDEGGLPVGRADRTAPVAERPKTGVPGPEMPDTMTALSGRLAGDDALRELIAETVRQELSGELGERITGSVRKLVRHELLRMLTATPDD